MIALLRIGSLLLSWTLVNGQNCTCGKEMTVTRIVGGREAKPNAHLWAAALVTSFKYEIFCGGSLINNRYILSAAHCMTPFVEDEIKVALGVHSLSTIEHLETVYDVDTIIVHPEYAHDDPYQLNDIALLRLDREVQFSSKIQPICLPDESLQVDYRRQSFLVVGWGRVSEEGDYSDKLREAYLPYVDNDECVQSYNENLITEKHICAGELQKDSCYGDSGGALIYFPAYKPAKGYQIGVVSWGIECGSNRPGVYTRVLSHIDWINEQTKDAVRCH